MPRNGLTIVAATLALAALAALVLYLTTVPTTLKVAVGPPGSDDARVIAALAKGLARERAPVRLRAISVESPGRSSEMLDAGEVDLAVVRSDVATSTEGETVVILRRNSALLITSAQSGVTRVADLKGRKIGYARAAPANARLLLDILSYYDIHPDQVRLEALGPEDIPTVMGEGSIDAYFTLAPPGSRAISVVLAAITAATGQPPVFVPIREASAIAARRRTVEAVDVVRGTFGGEPPKPPENFQTIAVTSRLLAQRSLSEDTVTELTRQIFALRPSLLGEAPSAQSIEAPSTDKGAALAVHPGAAAYYDDEEKTFFERYGDLIYLMLFAVSFVGSGLAAFVSRRTGRHRQDALTGLTRLVSILQAARGAPDEATLGALEQEADAILAEVLERASESDLDAAGLSAYRLAFEQVARAIAERRETLMDNRTPTIRAARPLP